MTCLMCKVFSFPECSVSLYNSINGIFVLKKKVAKNCASTCKCANYLSPSKIELSRVAPLNFCATSTTGKLVFVKCL